MKDMEPVQCEQLLEDNYVGHLAYIADNEPHVVPSTYFFDKGAKCILCFASNGHRIAALREHNKVSFQVDCIVSFRHWESVQVHGVFQELTGDNAKYCLKQFAEGVERTIDQKKSGAPPFFKSFFRKVASIRNACGLSHRSDPNNRKGRRELSTALTNLRPEPKEI